MDGKQQASKESQVSAKESGEETIEHPDGATEEPEVQAVVGTGGADIGRELLSLPLPIRVRSLCCLKPEELPEIANGEWALELPIIDRDARGIVNDPHSLEDIDVGEPAGREEEDEVGDNFPQGWVTTRPGEGHAAKRTTS